MDTKTFFNLVLPSQGELVVCHHTGSFRNYVASSADAAATIAGRLNPEIGDVFFGLSGFEPGTIKDYSGRAQANARWARSFWLDIDAGENKPYETPKDAYKALNNFVEVSKLPNPIIVATGGGLHAYWPLLEDIQTQTWAPVAHKLSALCTHLSLHVDPSRTKDSASVLRPVGIVSRKRGKLVKAVDYTGEPSDFFAFETALDAAIAAHGVVVPELAPIYRGSGEMDDLLRNLQVDGPKSLQRVMDGCAQLQFARDNPEAVSEPLWRGVLSIVRLTDGGIAACHDISRGHSNYSTAETSRKIEELARVGSGPYTCSTLSEGNDRCKGCPNNGRVTSPISLGLASVTVKRIISAEETDPLFSPPKPPTVTSHTLTGQEVVDRLYPTFPYKLDRTTKHVHFLTRTKVKDEDGNEKIVESEELLFPFDLYPTRLTDARRSDNRTDYATTWRADYVGGKYDVFDIPKQDFSERSKVLEHLHRRTIYSGTGGIEKENQRVAFMRAFLSNVTPNQTMWSPRAMGWETYLGNSVFVLGDKAIGAKGFVNVAHGDIAAVATKLVSQGSLTKWRKLYDQAYTSYEARYHGLASLGAFASPLLNMTAVSSFILVLYGSTGVGKSLLQKFGASVYGHPEMVRGAKDTLIYSMAMLSAMQNLPVYFDDLNNQDGETVSKQIYTFANGAPRGRATRSGAMQADDGAKWRTIITISSNGDYNGAIADLKANGSAELNRICQIPLQAVPGLDIAAGIEFSDALNENYGVAGETYIRYVVQNYDAIKLQVNQLTADLAEALESSTQERFIVASFAAMLVGGKIAKKLGLCGLDMQLMVTTAMEVIKSHRVSVEASTATIKDLLNEFMSLNLSNLILVRKNDNGQLMLSSGITKDYRQVVGRIEHHNKEVHISVSEFSKFCRHKGVNPKEAYDTLLKDGDILHLMPVGKGNYRPRRNLTSGTSHPQVLARTFTMAMISDEMIEAVEASANQNT